VNLFKKYKSPNLKKRNYLGDTEVDRRYQDKSEIEYGIVDWVHLKRTRDQWGALVNTVINLPFP
jgi:hypothetical protein